MLGGAINLLLSISASKTNAANMNDAEDQGIQSSLSRELPSPANQ